MQLRQAALAWPVCCLVVAVAYYLAWLLRFEFSIPTHELPAFWQGLALAVAIKSTVFCAMGLQLDRWSRQATFSDLVTLTQANAVGALATSFACLLIIGRQFPRSIYVLEPIICLVLAGGACFAARLLHEAKAWRGLNGGGKGLLVYGAGVAGLALAREIRGNPSLGYRVIGFIDDDPRKHGATMLGLPVLGGGNALPHIVKHFRNQRKRIEEVAVAMPSASGKQLRAAVDKSRAAGVSSRIVPGLGELISGKLAVRSLREVSVTDLLGREPLQLELEPIRRVLTGRRILVTGAAGSIGSELCHQLAELSPRQLVALDQAESELFRLESDLRARYPGLALVAEAGDVREARRIEQVIEDYGIEAIYHAAAYKHVPVMERQVCEAVRNNVLGTWNVAQAAWRMNVPRCLLVSTDKAVNPSSIMGLTKRVAELIVSSARPHVGRGPATRFMSVRFGNVLVSNGSVVPIFQKQIAAGGPVTVTHPEMRRYFMTVQEAVQLLLQASTMAQGSETYLLDMGKPVYIVELARKMITLAGLVPDEDIEIRFVGLRPGEKLFEELSLDEERLLPTNHPKIRIFQGPQTAFADLVPWIAELKHLLWRGDADSVVAHMAALVPEYRPMQESAPQPMPAARERAVPHARIAAAGAAAEAY